MNNGTSGDRKFVWNAENRLIEVKDESSGDTIATYAYDALGRRVHKSVSGGENTAFIYDDWNVIAEYQLNTENFELGTSYVWGSDLSGSMQGAGGVGGLLSVHQHSTDPNTQSPVTNHFFPTYDGNGNVSEYLDGSGNVAVHLEYDAFGKVVKSTGTVGNFRYRFSTKPQDDEIGWLYYGFRYCAPSEAWRLLRGESPRRKGPEGGSLMSQELAARFVSSLAGVKEGRKQPNNTTEA